jgi:hypothetical protein
MNGASPSMMLDDAVVPNAERITPIFAGLILSHEALVKQ